MKIVKWKQHSQNFIKYLAHIFLLAILYILLGVLGQSLALQQVSPVWPAAGVGFAALLLFGMNLWPGIWLGEFILNTYYVHGITFQPNVLISSAVLGVGGALSSWLSVYFIRRYSKDFFLDDIYSVIIFIFFAGLVFPMLAATIGCLSLTIAHLIPWDNFGWNLLTWWLGDSAGVIIIAPIIVAWYRTEIPKTYQWYLESLLLFSIILFIGYISFWAWFPIEYLLIPILITVCFRLGTKGTVLSILLIASMAILGTIEDKGVFVQRTRTGSLILLQTFLDAIALTGLILTATLSDLKKQMQTSEVARMEAEKANLAKTVFLTNMSRELRVPLNHILVFSKMIWENISKSQKELLALLEKIRQTAKQLLNSIDEILIFTQIETGKSEFAYTTFNVQTLIDELEEKFIVETKKNQNMLEFDVSKEVATLYTDKEKLSKILYNLLDNACKFTFLGTIRCEVKQIIDEQGQEWIRFSIEDSGVGMSQENINKLFQPFSKLSGSPTQRFAGSGLGLAVVQRYTQLLHGRIEVKSAANVGSTFTIYIPKSSLT